ncbi:MAG TPA: hypothetical protein VGE00_02480 [Gammaproteobacteria bacterium]
MERRCKRGLTGPLLLSLALLAGCGVKDDTVPADWYGVGDIYAYMKAVQDEEGKVTTTSSCATAPAAMPTIST